MKIRNGRRAWWVNIGRVVLLAWVYVLVGQGGNDAHAAIIIPIQKDELLNRTAYLFQEKEEFACRINVRSFGARNNKDSTKAFQKAFDAASKKGSASKKGLVIVPKGTYYLRGTLLVGSNLYVKCEDNARVIKKASDFAYMVRSKKKNRGRYGGVNNVTFEGGTWDAAYRKYTATVGGSNMCFVHARKLVFKNITFLHNFSTHMIELVGVSGASITGCKMHGYLGYSKYAKKEAIQLDIAHSSKVISNGQPYDDSPCENIVIRNNKIWDFPRAVGTHSSVSGIYNRNIIIESNTFFDLAAEGVYLFNFVNVFIEKNSMVNVGKGVLIKSSGTTYYRRNAGIPEEKLINRNYNILVKDNRIIANKKAGAFGTIAGIHGVGEKGKRISGIHIVNNKIESSSSMGIYFKYVSSCSIVGNICRKDIIVKGINNELQPDSILRAE